MMRLRAGKFLLSGLPLNESYTSFDPKPIIDLLDLSFKLRLSNGKLDIIMTIYVSDMSKILEVFLFSAIGYATQ